MGTLNVGQTEKVGLQIDESVNPTIGVISLGSAITRKNRISLG
jgi:hypothetical protein